MVCLSLSIEHQTREFRACSCGDPLNCCNTQKVTYFCICLQDFNDAMLTVFLSGITNGIEAVNEIVEKVSLAFDSKSARRRGML